MGRETLAQGKENFIDRDVWQQDRLSLKIVTLGPLKYPCLVRQAYQVGDLHNASHGPTDAQSNAQTVCVHLFPLYSCANLLSPPLALLSNQVVPQVNSTFGESVQRTYFSTTPFLFQPILSMLDLPIFISFSILNLLNFTFSDT